MLLKHIAHLVKTAFKLPVENLIKKKITKLFKLLIIFRLRRMSKLVLNTV